MYARFPVLAEADGRPEERTSSLSEQQPSRLAATSRPPRSSRSRQVSKCLHNQPQSPATDLLDRLRHLRHGFSDLFAVSNISELLERSGIRASEQGRTSTISSNHSISYFQRNRLCSLQVGCFAPVGPLIEQLERSRRRVELAESEVVESLVPSSDQLELNVAEGHGGWSGRAGQRMLDMWVDSLALSLDGLLENNVRLVRLTLEDVQA